MAVTVERLEKDLVAEELSYAIVENEAEFTIVGTYKEPTPGFEPTVFVRRSDCKIRKITWR